MSSIDYGSIGPDRTFKTSEEAVESRYGKYDDKAAKLSDEVKYFQSQFPMAPAPAPFANMRRVGGQR